VRVFALATSVLLFGMQEARCLYRCRTVGIDVPAVLFLDEACGRIIMEDVAGETLKDFIFAHAADTGALALMLAWCE